MIYRTQEKYLGARRIWLVEACFADPPASESRKKASLNPAGHPVGHPAHGCMSWTKEL